MAHISRESTTPDALCGTAPPPTAAHQLSPASSELAIQATSRPEESCRDAATPVTGCTELATRSGRKRRIRTSDTVGAEAEGAQAAVNTVERPTSWPGQGTSTSGAQGEVETPLERGTSAGGANAEGSDSNEDRHLVGGLRNLAADELDARVASEETAIVVAASVEAAESHRRSSRRVKAAAPAAHAEGSECKSCVSIRLTLERQSDGLTGRAIEPYTSQAERDKLCGRCKHRWTTIIKKEEYCQVCCVSWRLVETGKEDEITDELIWCAFIPWPYLMHTPRPPNTPSALCAFGASRTDVLVRATVVMSACDGYTLDAMASTRACSGSGRTQSCLTSAHDAAELRLASIFRTPSA